ncbi:SPOR domain-containing protein [Janthinobacterium tructae]|nr:SPOR domain-containing protein [Janthinobacterium tructae]MDI3294890.1 SPOR domain-containing protein [Janthinobacterium tructae]MDI3294891.1 SPOR domain-containing protein [Janthinobacterium tructae]
MSDYAQALIRPTWLFRLYGGPFTSRAEAARAAANLPESTGIKPIVIER